MAKQWIVVKTKARKERWAAENVVRQGYTPYVPMVYSIARPKGGGSIAVSHPLFPGYMFVETEGQWKFLLGTFGVAGIVLVGDKPAVIATELIEQLKAREDGQGLVVLPKPKFESGQRVKIKSGVFADRQGIYDGQSDKDRLQVLIDVLGRKTRVFIAEDQLEA